MNARATAARKYIYFPTVNGKADQFTTTTGANAVAKMRIFGSLKFLSIMSSLKA